MARAAVLLLMAVGCSSNWDTADDTGDSDSGTEPGGAAKVTTAFCAAGGLSYAGDMVHIACFAPGDPAATIVTGDGLTWEPGPIYRLQPAEE